MPENLPETPPLDPAEESRILNSYWRKNITVMLILLLIWAGAGLGCGILFADKLNAFYLPGTGYPLGFWFAQQGSIAVFVVLILVYALIMNRLDRSHMADRAKSRAGKEGAK